MKRVLQVVCHYYPNIGGIEQVARDIVGALLKMDDIEQKVICFNGDAEFGGLVCHRSETVHDYVDGVEIIRCGCFAKVASQQMSLTYPRELKRVMNSFKPDIVIFHYPNPYLTQFLLSYRKRDFKLVVYWHLDITKQKVLGKLFHGQNMRLLKRADKVVATSPNYIVGSPYLAEFRNKCIVIPNCVQTERLAITFEIEKKAAELREKHIGKTICFSIGRHVPYKGMTYLVQASKYLNNSFKILIGGKGPLTDSLMAEAKGDEKIEFLGRISDEDMVACYSACDVFCFPSITKNEAFGIALAEGMYFGKPAVTFTIPSSGVNYVNLNGITGVECPNGDSEAYAEALKKLANDEELRKELGKNARERVFENFTEKQFNANIQRLIQEI